MSKMVFDKTTNSEKDTYVLKSGNEKTLSIARNVYLVIAVAYVRICRRFEISKVVFINWPGKFFRILKFHEIS